MYALKKPDGQIHLVHGNVNIVKQDGDEVFELPVDWEIPSIKFRDCLRESSGEIAVNLELARAQVLEEVRRKRDEKLLETDAEYTRLHSMDQDLTAVKAKKQVLRDLPEAVESELAALDLEALESYEPTWP
jgi:hypothetical protein